MKIKNMKNIKIYYEDEKYLKILDELENLEIKKVLKDDKRSKVSLFEFLGEELVFKVPREKNNRKWQRLLSFIRGSESYREYLQAKKINENNFTTFKPILAFEKTKFNMAVDSFFICEFLKGEEGKIEKLEQIKKELDKIHKKGFLHGDSQLVNFITNKKKTYIIDSKFRKNVFGKFGQAYEYIYLEESCHQKIEYDKTTIYYKLALMLNKLLHFKGNLKNKLRGKAKK